MGEIVLNLTDLLNYKPTLSELDNDDLPVTPLCRNSKTSQPLAQLSL
jgi:hypothetical protein